MSFALVSACLWVLTASVVGSLPSRDQHWRAARVLMAAGVPILVAVFLAHGPLFAGVALAAGLSIFRYPVRHALAWMTQRFGG
ncbi:DUF2484 family protein [Pseudaestuariivita sp.]|uniref:DUF2484 family protein n=1 Tax=Pseudaestuariivita sp. TaxID=2211669 RepID=UPI0040595FD6